MPQSLFGCSQVPCSLPLPCCSLWSNLPSQVDEAMLDRITLVAVPLPDEDMRKNFFERKFKRIPAEDGFTLDDMADCTDNYSFRDLDRLVDTIRENIRKLAIEQFRVLGPDGEIDRPATDLAASQAVFNGDLRLTRALFDEVRASLPPSSKADIRAELEAFEARVKGLN